MKRKFLLLLLLVLIAVLAAGCGRASGPLLTQLAVYGESALLESEGNALTAYTLADTKSDASYAILTGDTADTGMYLPQLLPGKYLILLGEEAPITTYSFEPLEGIGKLCRGPYFRHISSLKLSTAPIYWKRIF